MPPMQIPTQNKTFFFNLLIENTNPKSAILNIHNNILFNIAKGSVTALTHLDLSAKFDTIALDRSGSFTLTVVLTTTSTPMIPATPTLTSKILSLYSKNKKLPK